MSDFKAFKLIDTYRLCAGVEQRTRTRVVSETTEKNEETDKRLAE